VESLIASKEAARSEAAEIAADATSCGCPSGSEGVPVTALLSRSKTRAMGDAPTTDLIYSRKS